MTEAPTPPAPAKSAQTGGMNQLLVDLGPIVIFTVAYNVLLRFESTKDDAIYWATGIFIAATLATIVWCKLTRGKIPPVLIITGVLVTVFGGLTILLHDPAIIQIKFTVTNLFYATAILTSLALRQNIWKLFFQHAFDLPDRVWGILALRWSGFFVVMAVVNEVLRRQYNMENGNFEIWANARPIATYSAFFLFSLINLPIVLKHQREEEETPAPAAPGA